LAPSCDVVVAGLGVMGSATADALAGRGLRVLGLDRFAPPHGRGSSHGRSRVIREAYFEHPLYVPLVRRAYELWHQLERERGAALFTRTGVLSVGPADGTVVAGARRSAREHGLDHEELDERAIRERWPAVAMPAGASGLFEPRAGLLDPEASVAALLARARGRGAELRRDEPLLSWKASGSGVEVRTPAGVVHAGALVLSAGAWNPALIGATLPLRVERRIVHWFAPARDAAALRADRCPILLWEHAAGSLFYTAPDLGHGVKAAFHNEGEATDPDEVRPPSAEDERRSRAALEQLLPAAAGALLDARTCLYTLAPDGHFVLDHHPEHPQVLLVSPCSGHGFKFGPAIGELVAELVACGRTRADLSPFALARLS
jgi:sarcosine oxidase